MVTQFPQLGKVAQCPPPPPLSQNQLWDQSSFFTQSNQNRLNQGRAPVYPQWVPSTLLGAVQQSSRGLPTTWSKGSLGQAKENPPSFQKMRFSASSIRCTKWRSSPVKVLSYGQSICRSSFTSNKVVLRSDQISESMKQRNPTKYIPARAVATQKSSKNNKKVLN